VAVGGHQPIGYYKDPDKTAATFLTVDGKRYSMPGDFATVEADGTITLLGRGSVCINTGGEKVFPEEVEEVLKTPRAPCATPWPWACPTTSSARPSPRWWSSPPMPTSTRTTSSPTSRASWPTTRPPSGGGAIDTIGRAPNGKVDYKRLYAMATLGIQA
jgi:hypothetical protein